MTTLPNIDLHMKKLEDLQTEILVVDATSLGDKKHLIEIIIKTHDLLAEIIKLGKKNKSLALFLNNIYGSLLELYQTSQSNEENAGFTKSREILQQLATIYQESIVPMLTRLHNLSTETEQMSRITSIASLGNEIITCSSQFYQFSEKIDTIEKISAMLGTILMFAGISLSIATLSNYTEDTPLFSSLTCITLGCLLATKAMDHYKNLPEADLARTALANIPVAIGKIDKSQEEQAYLQEILANNTKTDVTVAEAPQTKTKTKTVHKTVTEVKTESFTIVAPQPQQNEELKSEQELTTTPSLFQKMKSFMGFVKDTR